MFFGEKSRNKKVEKMGKSSGITLRRRQHLTFAIKKITRKYILDNSVITARKVQGRRKRKNVTDSVQARIRSEK